MPEVSLTDFVDFAMASGPPRVTKVRQLKTRGDYDPATDFWKRLRDGIETFHREGKDRAFLDEIRTGLTDQKKLTAYPVLITAYRRFLGRKKIEWFEPPFTRWSHAGLTVRVNPELGLRIDGNPYAIKLYFKKEKLSKRKVDSVLHVMDTALPRPAGRTFAVAVLDVPRARLVVPTVPIPGLDLLLKSEAAAFIQIWQGL